MSDQFQLFDLHQQDSLKEAEFFNAFTQEKDYDSLTPYGYRSIARAFERLTAARLPYIRSAVDLGCGTGSFTRRFLKDERIRSFGVDIAFNAIRRAQEKKDGAHYFVSDISQLGIKSNSMDLVIFSGVLHHFPNPGFCLREAHRILKKGGLLLSYDPHINNPCMWLYRHPDSPFCSKTGRTDNEKLLEKEDMHNGLQQAGFTNIRTEAISGVTISYLESRKARIFLPLYNTAEFLLGVSPLARTIGSFLICCAEKK